VDNQSPGDNISEWTPEVLSDHFASAIGRSELRTNPSPHLVVENVFPAGFYSDVRSNLPRKASLYRGWGIGKEHGKTHYQLRNQIYIHNRDVLAQMEFDSPTIREFWLNFHTWFTSQRLQDLMLSPFELDLRKRFGGEVRPASGKLITNGMINFHDAGYFIGPHPDTPDRVVTAIFYLPEEGAPEGLGTKFYRPKDPNYRSGQHGRFEDFEEVASAPFRENTALLFLRNNNSYHGVEPISQEQRAASQRFVIQYMLVHRHGKEAAATS
jgi:hypothetical protein